MLIILFLILVEAGQASKLIFKKRSDILYDLNLKAEDPEIFFAHLPSTITLQYDGKKQNVTSQSFNFYRFLIEPKIAKINVKFIGNCKTPLFFVLNKNQTTPTQQSVQIINSGNLSFRSNLIGVKELELNANETFVIEDIDKSDVREMFQQQAMIVDGSQNEFEAVLFCPIFKKNVTEFGFEIFAIDMSKDPVPKNEEERDDDSEIIIDDKESENKTNSDGQTKYKKIFIAANSMMVEKLINLDELTIIEFIRSSEKIKIMFTPSNQHEQEYKSGQIKIRDAKEILIHAYNNTDKEQTVELRYQLLKCKDCDGKKDKSKTKFIIISFVISFAIIALLFIIYYCRNYKNSSDEKVKDVQLRQNYQKYSQSFDPKKYQTQFKDKEQDELNQSQTDEEIQTNTNNKNNLDNEKLFVFNQQKEQHSSDEESLSQRQNLDSQIEEKKYTEFKS